jgi:hypothetical protein
MKRTSSSLDGQPTLARPTHVAPIPLLVFPCYFRSPMPRICGSWTPEDLRARGGRGLLPQGSNILCEWPK